MAFARFLFRNLAGYRFLIVIAIVMTIAQVGADIFSAFPLKFIIDKLTLPNHPDPNFPGASSLLAFFERFGTSINPVILLSVAIMLVLGVVSAAMSFVQIFLATFIAKHLTTRLSKRLFDHLQRLPVDWHSKNEQGDLVQRVTGNMADLDKFVADGMVDTLAGGLTIVGVIAVMLYTNQSFTLLSLAIVPLLFVAVFSYTRGIKTATKKEKKSEGKVASVATETMSKIMEIKAFTLEKFIYGLFTVRAEEKLQAGKRAGSLQAQFTPLVNIMLVIGTAIIVGVGAFVASATKPISIGFLSMSPKVVTLGTLTVYITLLTKLYQPMRDLSKMTTIATSASSAAERIQDVLDEKIETLEIPEGYKGPWRLEGNINYEDTFFCYSFPGPPILKGVSLNIKAGEKVALVGLSGSGKTTLTNLLPRFYEVPPGWGAVQIDGIDVRQYPLTVVRQNISVVLQDSILFDGTIRENIKIGRPQASDAEMYKAAEQACIQDTIMKKPNGYNERIINQGKNLSGGQRQRIAIARAILRDAPIIIMDEPTASLDVEAEAEVMRALDGLAEGRTVLMITHRLSTVGKVDKIVVLKDGRIVEQGTYKELKKKDGIFGSLLKVQNVHEMDENTQSLIQTATPRPEALRSKGEVLIEVDGKIVGKHALNQIVLTIGRAPQNDIALSFNQSSCRSISRLHAKLLWKNNIWSIEDADSKHGIYYDGERIERRSLADGDRIFLTPTVALIYKQQNQIPVIAGPIQPQPGYQRAQVLIEIDGKVIGQHFLDKAILNIGRKWGESEHEIQIPSSYIARNLHAQIFWENGLWSIKSVNSKSGICYNGQIVAQHSFVNGDRIYLAPGIALIYQILP
jgi:ATP-binding cassette, subfamily B, bacterial